MSSLPLNAEFAANAGPGVDQGRAVRHLDPESAGACGRGYCTTSHCSPRREPMGLKGGPRQETPLSVRLHLLHVAHNAPTTAPVQELNVSHRDRSFAPTPLSVGFSFSCDVQINPAPMHFPLFFTNSYFSPTSEQSVGGKKKRGKSGAKSPAEEHSGIRGWRRPPFQKRTRSISSFFFFFSMNWRPKRQRRVSFPGR